MGRIRSTSQPAVSTAHLIPAHIDTLLVNWGRWAAGREGRVQRHVNAQFTQAARGSRWQPCAASAPRLDADTAWQVEQTVCDPIFSPRWRTLLVEHYAHQRRPRDTCKLLFIAWQAYDAELCRAAMSFWARYQKRFSGA